MKSYNGVKYEDITMNTHKYQPTKRPTISWTRPMLERFKVAYNEHKKHCQTNSFEFDGNLFVVSYARYLIEYLEGKL